MQKLFFALLLLVHATSGFAAPAGYGTLKGKVLDSKTKQVLPGVTIQIKKISAGTQSDSLGGFTFRNVQPGLYTIQFSSVGYQQLTLTDITVRPDRVTELDAELTENQLKLQEVVVSGGYFSSLEQKPLSMTSFSAEEVRRSPGTAGDISRILFSLPSVAKVNDQRNSLIVRGGSPVENSYYLDNIEIPNINHFPVQGSSDGPIGLINLYYVKDVNFHTGGFSPKFGDRLSSVMEIQFREGSKEKIETQTELSMSGFGASVEGPIGKNSSFMISANKSYLDLIVDAAQTGGALPNYGDMQGKVVIDLEAQNKLTILNVLSLDYIDLTYKNAVKAESAVYGLSKGGSNVFGMNWLHVHNAGGFSNTSLSWSVNKYDRDYSETRTKNHLFTNKSDEHEITFRYNTFYALSKAYSIEAGIESKTILNTFNMLYESWVDDYGKPTGALLIDKRFSENKSAVYLSNQITITPDLQADLGVRGEYFTFNKSFTVAPRISLTYAIDDLTKASLSSGIFYQQMPNVLLAQNSAFSGLAVPKSTHYILGISRMLNESTRLSVEGYVKEYANFPMDPTQPREFLFDQVMKMGLFLSHPKLADNGRAKSTGVEVIIQKKLADEYYGLASCSFAKSKYRDYTNTWQDRMYDNRINFTFEGGYIPGNNWEFKIRWSYAGGAPYTPFDAAASQQKGKGVLDESRTNSLRLPDYHSLNVRVDKRFNFERSNLLVYLSVWNAYGRNNIAGYEWNEIKNEQREFKQWSTLPVIGITYEL